MVNTLQKDLFQAPHTPATREKMQTPENIPSFLDRFRISFRLDQVLFGTIALLVLYAMVFSWGVEKGRQIVRGEWDAAKIAEAAALLKAHEDAPEAVGRSEEQDPTAAPATKTVQSAESGANVPPPMNEGAKQSPPKVPGKYTIQVITYKWQTAAERRAKELAQKGLTAFVIPSGKYFLVCVDSFESKEKAKFALTQLKTQKFVPKDAYIRPVAMS